MSAMGAAAWLAAFFLSSVLFSHTVALRLLLLIGGTLLTVRIVARNGERVHALPAIWLPYALWALWAGLSLAWSLEPARSAKEFQNEIVYCAMALWMSYCAGQSRDAVRVIPAVLALATAAVCAVALYWFQFGFYVYGLGAHGGPGSHSSALITLMPCVVMALWYSARGESGWKRQWPGAALAGLMLLSAYTTLNRTVWIAFALQAVVMGTLILRHRSAVEAKPLSARAKAIAIALAALVLAGGGLVAAKIQSERQAMGSYRSLVNDQRFSLWQEIAERIRERPLTGYGFGRGILRRPLREESGQQALWHSHNLFLDTAVQTGAPGLILLLLLLAATVREGWRAATRPGALSAASGIALVAVVAGMVVRNMTDVLWVRQNALLYWGIVGVLLAWCARGRAASD